MSKKYIQTVIRTVILSSITGMSLNIFLISNAYAYFDPGTGSLLIQSCIAFFGIIMVYMHRFRTVFLSVLQRCLMKLKKIFWSSQTELDKL